MSGKNNSLLARLALVAAVIAVISTGPMTSHGAAGAQTRATPRYARYYACPMHPEVRSLKRGKCPKCGMSLRLVETASGTGAAAPTNPPSVVATTDTADTSSFTSTKIPDITVYDQNGKQLHFYSDLIKGKTVAINFIFTTCTTICPPLTATFRRVQQDLRTSAPEATLISISVDPTTDNPQRLNDFAARFKAGPGWSFVTGDKADITSLLRALGAAVGDKNDHTPMILIGNDPAGYWTRAYGLASPTTLVKRISEAAKK